MPETPQQEPSVNTVDYNEPIIARPDRPKSPQEHLADYRADLQTLTAEYLNKFRRAQNAEQLGEEEEVQSQPERAKTHRELYLDSLQVEDPYLRTDVPREEISEKRVEQETENAKKLQRRIADAQVSMDLRGPFEGGKRRRDAEIMRDAQEKSERKQQELQELRQIIQDEKLAEKMRQEEEERENRWKPKRKALVSDDTLRNVFFGNDLFQPNEPKPRKPRQPRPSKAPEEVAPPEPTPKSFEELKPDIVAARDEVGAIDDSTTPEDEASRKQKYDEVQKEAITQWATENDTLVQAYVEYLHSRFPEAGTIDEMKAELISTMEDSQKRMELIFALEDLYENEQKQRLPKELVQFYNKMKEGIEIIEGGRVITHKDLLNRSFGELKAQRIPFKTDQVPPDFQTYKVVQVTHFGFQPEGISPREAEEAIVQFAEPKPKETFGSKLRKSIAGLFPEGPRVNNPIPPEGSMNAYYEDITVPFAPQIREELRKKNEIGPGVQTPEQQSSNSAETPEQTRSKEKIMSELEEEMKKIEQYSEVSEEQQNVISRLQQEYVSKFIEENKQDIEKIIAKLHPVDQFFPADIIEFTEVFSSSFNKKFSPRRSSQWLYAIQRDLDDYHFNDPGIVSFVDRFRQNIEEASFTHIFFPEDVKRMTRTELKAAGFKPRYMGFLRDLENVDSLPDDQLVANLGYHNKSTLILFQDQYKNQAKTYYASMFEDSNEGNVGLQISDSERDRLIEKISEADPFFNELALLRTSVENGIKKKDEIDVDQVKRMQNKGLELWLQENREGSRMIYGREELGINMSIEASSLPSEEQVALRALIDTIYEGGEYQYDHLIAVADKLGGYIYSSEYHDDVQLKSVLEKVKSLLYVLSSVKTIGPDYGRSIEQLKGSHSFENRLTEEQRKLPDDYIVTGVKLGFEPSKEFPIEYPPREMQLTFEAPQTT